MQIAGAQRIGQADDGRLIVTTGNGDITLTAPVAYQDIAGQRRPVPVAYALNTANKQYGFVVGDYDATQPLIIDPLLQSTYLGSTGSNTAAALAIHPSTGEVYLTGTTTSSISRFPGVSGGAQSLFGGDNDAFVSRLSADLKTLIQSTYLGAAASDGAYALAIHPTSGEIYAAGDSTSTTNTLPGVTLNGGGAQVNNGGGVDAFVARFSADLSALDKTPNAFVFAPQLNAPISSVRTSAPVQLTGFVGASNAYIEGQFASSYCLSSGNNCSCDVNSDGLGTFVTILGPASPGNFVCVRHTSSALLDHLTSTTLHVGGAAATFNVTTGTRLGTNCTLDVEGNGGIDALTDGLLILRAMFGLTGASVTNGAVGGNPARADWASIRTFLNGNCGTNFSP